MSPTHRNPPFIRRRATQSVLAAMVVALLPDAVAAEAARVTYARGPVAAVGTDGASRALARGAEIDAGDTIRTGTGRAQLRFTDGSFVSLKPDTEFRVDAYEYEGKPAGEERGFFSLLRGGLRTITGLIGRTRSGSYRMNTPVATIGIRGTGYNLDLLTSATGVQQLKWNVANGTISVQLADGTWLNFSQGGAGTATQAQFEQLQTALQQLADEGGLENLTAEDLIEVFAAGDQVNADGLSSLLADLIVTKAPPPDCASAQPGCAIAGAYGFDSNMGVLVDGGEGNIAAVFDAITGALQSYAVGGPATDIEFIGVDGGEGNTFNTGSNGQLGTATAVVDGSAYFSVDPANPQDPRAIATWGRWIGPGATSGDFPHPETLTGRETFAYVVSIPPAVTPSLGVGQYTLSGFTPPAVIGPGAAALGAPGVVTGTLTADFGAGVVGLNMRVPFANGAYQLQDQGGLNMYANESAFQGQGTPFFKGNLIVNGTDAACVEGCDGYAAGNLFGPRADGAALGYQVVDYDLPGYVSGAAVFRQTSIGPGAQMDISP